MRVLCCDDHPLMRSALRLITQELLPASEYVELGTLEALHRELELVGDVRLVLLDLGLPDGDGLAAIGEVAERAAAPVVVISARERPAEIWRALGSGAVGYVSKSASLGELRQAIGVVLAGGTYVPAAALNEASGGASAMAARRRGPARETDRDQRPEGLESLTARQLEVLELLARGLTNPEICSALGISVNTVKAHVRSILLALDVTNRTEAALVWSEAASLIEPVS